MFTIDFYETPNGLSYVRDYLEELQRKSSTNMRDYLSRRRNNHELE